MARTDAQRQALRDAAAQVKADRDGLLPALKLAPVESMGSDSGIHFKTGGVNPGDVYIVVVEKGSGKGFVVVTEEGYVGPRIPVWPDQTGYETVKIEQGQHCIVYGSCAVFCIHRA